MKRVLLTVCLVLLSVSSFAQDWSCADPGNLPQQGMNYCAHKEYEKADADLNATWKRVFPKLKDIDDEMEDNYKGLPKAVLEAQRAWIIYRDAHCTSQGYKFRGGTLEPLIVSSCLAELTRQRTKQISDLLEDGF